MDAGPVLSVGPAEVLREELDLDSIDFINLLEAVTLETGAAISENDYAQVNTLQSMISFLESKKSHYYSISMNNAFH